MKRLISKILHHGLVVSAAVCLLPAVPCQGETEADGTIWFPDQELVSVQINGFKYYDFNGEIRSFDEFEEAFREVQILDGADIQRGDIFHVVTLTFEDQSKETFYFFQSDGAWYMEDDNGSIYQNADFIETYVTLNVLTSEGAPELSNLSVLSRIIRIYSQLETLGISYSTSDLRASFAIEIQKYVEMFDTEDKIVQTVRDALTGMLVQYQYAVDHGYAPTEAEFEQQYQELDGILRSASNFEEIEAVFETMDTTYDSYRSYMKEYDKIKHTNERFAQAIYEEFRYGNDQIGDHACEDATEYWNYYLMEIVYPEMEDYRSDTLIPLLDEAEVFYKDCLSD